MTKYDYIVQYAVKGKLVTQKVKSFQQMRVLVEKTRGVCIGMVERKEDEKK